MLLGMINLTGGVGSMTCGEKRRSKNEYQSVGLAATNILFVLVFPLQRSLVWAALATSRASVWLDFDEMTNKG